MNINPVTIPKSYGVKQIPNLLDAFNKLRVSGLVAPVLFDPFEPLEKPFEITDHNNDSDVYDNLYEDSDPAPDSEPEYENTFVFGWELARK